MISGVIVGPQCEEEEKCIHSKGGKTNYNRQEDNSNNIGKSYGEHALPRRRAA